MTSKIQKLAERAMGWTHWQIPNHPAPPLPMYWVDAGGKIIAETLGSGIKKWNPETNDADALDLLESCAKHVSPEQIYVQWVNPGWNAGLVGASYYVAGDSPRDVIVNLACQIFDVK